MVCLNIFATPMKSRFVITAAVVAGLFSACNQPTKTEVKDTVKTTDTVVKTPEVLREPADTGLTDFAKFFKMIAMTLTKKTIHLK